MAVCRPLPRSLMSDGAREASKLPPVVGLQPRKTRTPPSKAPDSSAQPLNGHHQGSRPNPTAQGTAARSHSQNGAASSRAHAEASLSVSEPSVAGDAPRQAAQPASLRAAAVVSGGEKVDDPSLSREQTASVKETAGQVRFLNCLHIGLASARLHACSSAIVLFVQQSSHRHSVLPKVLCMDLISILCGHGQCQHLFFGQQ